jgi:L-threonylcarbamoyladenylate synthase
LKKFIDLKNSLDYTKLKEAAEIIRLGGLVLFPTETVYGLGANGLDENAVKNIFKAKGRSSDNPLILHISDFNMLNDIVENISDVEYKLMKEFWPGPFTIILNRKPVVPNIVTANLDTVGIRMPSNKIANKLISYSGLPIAAPSANISGKPSGTNISDIFDELSDKVDCIIDGGNTLVGLESTVVRVIDGIPTILRPGKITPEDIKRVVGNVKIDKHIFSKLEDGEKVLSPGMKYKHYAPDSKCVLVYSDNNDLLVKKINEISMSYQTPLILSTSENVKNYENKLVIDIGSKYNLDEIAKNIFTDLRKVDKFNPDIVIIEGVKQEGLGLAIMNRLVRACSHNYIEI